MTPPHQRASVPTDLARRDAATRHAVTRRASLALCAAASEAVRTSRATVAAVAEDRARWRAWHSGLAEWRGRPADRVGPRLLRVCMGCDRVCFTPSEDVGRVSGGTAEVWVRPPRHALATLVAGHDGPHLSHGLCLPCAHVMNPDPVDANGVPTSAAPLDTSLRDATIDTTPNPASAILDAFAEIEAFASTLIERRPWVDEWDAWDEALETAARRLMEAVPTEDVSALIEQLHALASALRLDARSSRRAADRFRPALQRG
jgi:hypothetical protein